ncbi:MAG: chemotaxis protein CheW, partial [Bryobacteraceae bacterium]|nr:chemotaxis protein CheW [Bryobacteraceae bacterium]
EDTPDFGQGVTINYVRGLAKVKGKVKILLDINEALASQELLSQELLNLDMAVQQ